MAIHMKGYVRFSSRMNRATMASDVEVVGANHDVLHAEDEAQDDLEHRTHHRHEEERGDPVANGAQLLQHFALVRADLPVDGRHAEEEADHARGAEETRGDLPGDAEDL